MLPAAAAADSSLLCFHLHHLLFALLPFISFNITAGTKRSKWRGRSSVVEHNKGTKFYLASRKEYKLYSQED